MQNSPTVKAKIKKAHSLPSPSASTSELEHSSSDVDIRRVGYKAFKKSLIRCETQ